MTVKIRARIAHVEPEAWVDATGATLAAAVRHVAGKLGLTPGRTLDHKRVDTHEHHWTWGRGSDVYELVIRESRSGPGGEKPPNADARRPVVSFSLSPATVERLDAAARAWGVSRSAALERIVEAFGLPT